MSSSKSSQTPAAVSVLGLGNWGTALANHLAAQGHSVLGWSHDPTIVAGINGEHRNPRYLSAFPLSKNLSATSDLTQALENKTIVAAIPSSALYDVVHKMKVRSGSIIISAIKGFESHTLLTPLQYFEKHLGSEASCCVLSGPSFAKDVIVHNPCGIVAASKDDAVARRTAELFTSDSMKVYLSSDPLGVELGGIVKNVIALAAGVSDGLGLGDSARAGLITRGLAEMMRLTEALGGDPRTMSGLSGLGDLAMTASCDASRNRTVGLRLGKGESLEQITQTLGSVAEAVKTTPLVLKIAQQHHVEMPITLQVARLIKGDVSAQEMARALITRPTRREF